MYKNILEKLNFQMEEIKLFDSFAGIGALYKANKKLGIPIKLVGSSEIDPYAIMDYAVIHDLKLDNVKVKSEQEMKDYLLSINIGWDFEKEKSTIKSWKGEKLERLYKSCIAMNNYGDISIINPSELPDFDLFNFSFCCQCISVAGNQEGMTKEDGSITRSGLYIYGMKIIKTKKPKYIMIENVKNLVGKKFKNDFDKIIKELQNNNYNTYWQVLNAKDYGIPQNRERVFVICIRKDIDNNKFKFPKDFDNGLRLKNFLEDKVDEKYYINQQKCNELINQVSINETNKLIQAHILSGGKWDKINESCRRVYDEEGLAPTIHTCQGGNTEPKVVTRNITEPTICEQRCDEGLRFFKDNVCGTIRTIDAGGDKRVIETMIPPKPELVGGIGKINFGKQYRQGNRVYSSDKTAMCLMAQPVGNTGGYSYLYNIDYRIRKLIPLECLRLMGFEDEDYYKIKDIGVSDTQIYKQAGNSIVVNVLYYIFKELFKEFIK